MARLNARQRVQPVAPKPISRDDQVPRIIAVSPEPSPTFRLASEVPLRRTSRPTNPFADDTAALAAQDQLPGGPQASSTGITAADDAPVGTGVAGVGSAATKGAGAEADPFGDVAADTIPADPFAADSFAADPFAASASPPVAAPAAPSRKSTGIFGAVFRAIRKATIPQLDPAAMLPPGMGPPAGGPRQPAINQFPEDSFPKDDPFGDPAEGSDEIPGGDDADPFGL